MPRIVNTAMKISKRNPNVAMFGKVFIILASRTRKDVQFLANLKTLSSRMLLRTKTSPPILTPLIENITLSTILTITMKASNRLKLSRAYITGPRPISLITISMVKSQLQIWFSKSSIGERFFGSGNRSNVMMNALTTMIKVNATEKTGFMHTL